MGTLTRELQKGPLHPSRHLHPPWKQSHVAQSGKLQSPGERQLKIGVGQGVVCGPGTGVGAGLGVGTGAAEFLPPTPAPPALPPAPQFGPPNPRPHLHVNRLPHLQSAQAGQLQSWRT